MKLHYLIAISIAVIPCLLTGANVPEPALMELPLPPIPTSKIPPNNTKIQQPDQTNTVGFAVLGKQLPNGIDAFGLSASEEFARSISAKQVGTDPEYPQPNAQNIPTKLEISIGFLKVQGYVDDTEVIINGRLISLNEWIDISIPDSDMIRAKVVSINSKGILLASDDDQTVLLPIPFRTGIGDMDKEPPFTPPSEDKGKIKSSIQVLPITKQRPPSRPNNK